jgi:hypothetical protein
VHDLKKSHDLRGRSMKSQDPTKILKYFSIFGLVPDLNLIFVENVLKSQKSAHATAYRL